MCCDVRWSELIFWKRPENAGLSRGFGVLVQHPNDLGAFIVHNTAFDFVIEYRVGLFIRAFALLDFLGQTKPSPVPGSCVHLGGAASVSDASRLGGEFPEFRANEVGVTRVIGKNRISMMLS